MAGSRQGWVEAGYLDTPADIDQRLARHATMVPDTVRQIIIVPGLAVRSLKASQTSCAARKPSCWAPILRHARRRDAAACPARIRNGSAMRTVCGHRFRNVHDRRVVLRGYRKDDPEAYSTGGEGPVDCALIRLSANGVRDGWTRPAN
jgi:2-dehydro-3-deoxygalactonokinase